MSRSLPARGRSLIPVAAAVLMVLLAAQVWPVAGSRHVWLPLEPDVVVIGPGGARTGLPAGKALLPVFPGTRVLQSAGEEGRVLAQEQLSRLASGTIPAVPAEYQDLVRTSLLDLDTLLLPGGALVAGWAPSWRYVWPRDASLVAVAMFRTGHPAQARQILMFLQRVMASDGVFQARYRPDGSGPPDDRGVQTDGTGWVLWAVAQIMKDLPAGRARAEFLADLRPMIDLTTEAALRLTSGPGALPGPSQDYWEIHDRRLSLGTAAPLWFGLEAAGELQRELSAPQLAGAAERRARTLRVSIDRTFGEQGYPRYLGDDRPDASIAFLLPPFAKRADPAVVRVWRRSARAMLRPAGGLVPGTNWNDDGVSWTTVTSLYGLTAASLGDRGTTDHWLGWLSAHRTQYGALPEKVLSDGSPAGPAPLTWTDAFVVLAADTMYGSVPYLDPAAAPAAS